jgi:MFS family permease
MRPNRSFPFLIVLSLATFGYGAWANINNPNLTQLKLTQLAPPEWNNTLLGLFGVAGLAVATVAQPILGVLSDRTRGRFGRRAPYLIAGAIGCSAMVAVIAAADSLWVILAAILLNQVFSNTIQGPVQALIPDQVSDRQRGLAAGLKTLIELFAVIASGVVVRELLAKGRIDATVIATILIIIVPTVITVLAVRDAPMHDDQPDRDRDPVSRPPFRAFVRDLLRNPTHENLRWWLLNRYLFWSGLIALRQFIINYLRDVWGFSNEQALAINGEFTILLGIGVVLVTIPAGFLSDRVGRTRLIAGSCLTAAVGVVILLTTRDIGVLRVVAVIVGAGAGVYFSVNWALVTSLVPTNEAALYLGIANIATTFGSATGQIGGPFIDLINRVSGSTLGYTVLFAFAGVLFVIGSGVVLRVHEKR